MLLTTSSILASLQIGENETDRLALLEIKAKMVDLAKVLSLWNESNDFRKWHGVRCGRKYRRVNMLSLETLNLSGTLSLTLAI